MGDGDDRTGAIPSITIALFADSELLLPGVGSVNTASLPAASRIVPPLLVRAVVE